MITASSIPIIRHIPQLCFNCVYDAQIVYFRSCIYDDIVSYSMLTIESLEYWPQSELVNSKWVNEHLEDNKVRIVEVIFDSKNRNSHNETPGAAVLDWNEDIDQTDYQDPHGLNDKTTIVLYSDFNNWFASITYWIFKHVGHDNVRLLQGG
jgi:hypothetical protein